jgi:mycothiol synthase
VVELPRPVVPEGYVLRRYQLGDEDGWLALLDLAGFCNWDRRRIDAFLEDAERRDGSRLVTTGTNIVAATLASRAAPEHQAGILDYVVSHPRHRRRGLARSVCVEVLKFLAARGYPAVTLSTDDWRLAAIGLYLSLGFVPMMEREDMPSRWEAVMGRLELGRR